MMKRLNIAVIMSALVLLFSGAAMADDASKKSFSNHQFSGQRPYMKAPVEDNAYKADDQWEGATLVTDEETVKSKSHAKHNQMRLHMLGKRPYIEHATD